MSKFYLSLKEKPKVVIEFSEDLADNAKPMFEKIFGVAFLASETNNAGILRYEFKAPMDEINIIEEAFFSKDRIVKEIDAEIHLN